MNKVISLLVLVSLFTFLPSLVLAHPGRTDGSGCHTCRTNCANWGLSSGEYHCHNAKALPQPEAPIRSHYGENGTGYTESWPEYANPAPVEKKIVPTTPKPEPTQNIPVKKPVVEPKPVKTVVTTQATTSTSTSTSSSTTTKKVIPIPKKPAVQEQKEVRQKSFLQRLFSRIF